MGLAGQFAVLPIRIAPVSNPRHKNRFPIELIHSTAVSDMKTIQVVIPHQLLTILRVWMVAKLAEVLNDALLHYSRKRGELLLG